MLGILALMPVLTGLDILAREEFARLEGRSIGLLCNQASISTDLRHIVDLLLEPHRQGRLKIQAVFGPEHGLWGHTQDNMIEWEGGPDPRTGLAIHSLYGKDREPTDAMLDGIDLFLVDIPDVGARYYTFIWSMALCMKACRPKGIPVMVLDRPNPIGGVQVEGPVMEQELASFVGLYPLPARHGMTVGEVARYLHDLCPSTPNPLSPPFIGAKESEGPSSHPPRCVTGESILEKGRLEVITMQGWQREMYFEDSGLPWAVPSPNMPCVETAVVYPGQCLLEATTLSEGRGTTRPFEIFGAPGLDGWKLAENLNKLGLPGVHFRPIQFEPTFNKHARILCEGAFIHVTNRQSFRPVVASVAILQEVQRLGGLEWNPGPYEYEVEKRPIDLLAGNTWLARAIESLTPLARIGERLSEESEAFAPRRAAALTY